MEKMVVEFGIGLTCFFFLLMFVIGSEFFIGAVIGLLIAAFGWFFWEE